MPTALVPLVDGFEETEAIAVIDILRRGGVEVTTAGIGKLSATGSHNITVQTDEEFGQLLMLPYGAVVLPGGPGTFKLNEVPGMHELLRRQAESGRLVAAICAAPTVLASAGLLKGRTAACFPAVESKMAGVNVQRIPVVEDGNLITSRAVGTAIPFALHLVARLMGAEKAEEVARSIVFDWSAPVSVSAIT